MSEKAPRKIKPAKASTSSEAPQSASVSSAAPDEPHTEVAAVTDLKPHPRNYKKHPDDQVEHLVKSLTEHGFYRHIVVARDNTILAGHGVHLAAQKMGLTSVPIIRLDVAPDDPRALKVMTGDNEISHLGERDDRVLTELLKEISEVDVDGLLGTGFDPMMLANLLMVSRPEEEIKGIEEAAHWAGMPEFEAAKPTMQLNVFFEDEKEREAFIEKVGVIVTKKYGNSWSCWWPPRDRLDTGSLRFAGEGEEPEKAAPDEEA